MFLLQKNTNILLINFIVESLKFNLAIFKKTKEYLHEKLQHFIKA